MSREAVKTTTALLESSLLVGHVTLWTSSLYDSLKLLAIFLISILAREERLELPTLGFGDRCSTN